MIVFNINGGKNYDKTYFHIIKSYDVAIKVYITGNIYIMKPFYLLALFILSIWQQSTGQAVKMTGSYKMLKQTAHSSTFDTAYTNDQFKIYTDHHFMFVVKHSNDSLCEYGIGKYKISGNSVVENIIHSTFSDNAIPGDDIVLKITKQPKGYRQEIVFKDSANRDYLLSEDYENVSTKIKSPLDGAWKQTKIVYNYTNGDSITIENTTQYKVYHSGHFIWANTNKDSATNKPVSFFGYGTFKMDANNQSIEINQNSSFKSALVGIPISVKIEMKGPDAYQQTIVSEDGGIGKEFYERLK